MLRTLVATLAIGLTAGVAGTTPAHATARACLNSFDGPFFADGYGQTVLYPSRRVVRTDAYISGSSCNGARASLGISRPDGSDFRNVNGSFHYDGEINHFDTTQPMRWTDTGTWVIRQVAVYKNGVLVVKRYGADQDRTIVRRGSTISGRPKGTLAPPPGHRHLVVEGTLKAYTTAGSLVPLKRQPIEVWASRAGVTRRLVRENNSTHASGYYAVLVDISRLHGYAITVVYPSPYQTIARSSVYLGITR